MRDARARLTAMVEELRASPRVDLVRAEIGAPATDAELAAATAAGGGRLPAGVAEFYAEVGSFGLEWRRRVPVGGDLTDCGLVEILPVGEVFGDWEGVTWFEGEEDGDEFRPVLPFDMWVPEACMAFVRPEGGAVGDHVAYHYFGEELCETGYGFDEYVERLLVSRGYWYWPVTLCAEEQRTVEAEAFRRGVGELFEGVDLGMFVPRG